MVPRGRGLVVGCVLQLAPVLGLLDKLPKNADTLILNIGSNRDAVMPINEKTTNRNTVAVAIEPIVPHLTAVDVEHRFPNALGKQFFIVPAAVSATDGLAMMEVTGRSSHWAGSTSSLSPVADNTSVANARSPTGLKKAGGALKVVPVLGMRTVLDAIPSSIALALLFTDMQGHDFEALRGAGEALQRAEFVKAETTISRNNYAGVNNSFCIHLLPYMDSIGFELVGVIIDNIRFDAQTARRHCRHAVEKWPGTKECDEGDGYFASPRRRRPRPPVRQEVWAWPDV